MYGADPREQISKGKVNYRTRNEMSGCGGLRVVQEGITSGGLLVSSVRRGRGGDWRGHGGQGGLMRGEDEKEGSLGECALFNCSKVRRTK